MKTILYCRVSISVEINSNTITPTLAPLSVG